MRRQLLPAVAPGRDHGGGGEPLGELRDRARPGLRGVAVGEGVVLGDVHGGDAVRAERAGRLGRAGAGDDGVNRLAARVAARERQRLQGELVQLAVRVLDEDEDHHATPSRRRTSTTAGAAAGPSPSSSACRPGPRGRCEAHQLQPRRAGFRLGALDRLAPGAQLRGHGRIARQVDPLLDRHDRRERDDVDIAARADLLLAAHVAVLHAEALEPRHARAAQRVGDADPDLVVGVVGGLRPEDDQIGVVARRTLGLDPRDKRGGRGLRVPVGAVGHQVDGAVDADRQRVAQLLLGLRGAEREHGRAAAVGLGDADGLLDPALLVRTDREAEVAGLDRALVRGEDDLAAGDRHPLDADEDVHDRIRALSGSKSGVEPATATVTG